MSKNTMPVGGRGEDPRSISGGVEPSDRESSVSLVELLSVLLRYRWSILLVPFVAFIVTVTLSLSRDRTYTSTAAFAPQTFESPSGGLAGVAAQFGISLPASRTAESPAFYADLLESREILSAAVLSEYELAQGPTAQRGNLIELLKITAPSEQARLDAAIRGLRGAMDVSHSRETGVIRVSVATKSPELSMVIAARLLELMNEFNLQRRQAQAAAERKFSEERVKAAAAELFDAEQRLQHFLQRNRQFSNSPELQFEHDRLQREVLMRQQLYTSLTQAYEQARIEEMRNIPVITVLERPVAPSIGNPRGTVLKGVLALVLGGMLGVLIAFGRDFARRDRIRTSSYDEFDRLRREALDDLRRPWSRLRRG